MFGERRGEPPRERHVALPSTLRCSHLSVPVRTTDTQLPLREIDIAPLERDHLAAPQPGLTAQQHDQVRPLIDFYFWRYFGENPFGHSGRRIADFYAGLVGDFRSTQKWKRLRRTKHDHHPVHDALGNAEALIRLLNGER